MTKVNAEGWETGLPEYGLKEILRFHLPKRTKVLLGKEERKI